MKILNFWWSFNLEPEKSDSSADISLADEDDEHEESSQHVAAVNDSKKHKNDISLKTRFSEVIMDNKMDILSDPRNSQNQEEF